MKRPKNAPGCYGIGVVCMIDKAHCERCPAVESCRVEAVQSLKQASALADVSLFQARFGQSSAIIKSEELTSDQINLLASTEGSKVRQIMQTFFKRSIPPAEFIRSGINPFVENRKPRFMFPVFDLLISRKGQEFTRQELTDHILNFEPNWTPATARSHSSTAIRVMQGYRVIKTISENHFKVEV